MKNTYPKTENFKLAEEKSDNRVFNSLFNILLELKSIVNQNTLLLSQKLEEETLNDPNNLALETDIYSIELENYLETINYLDDIEEQTDMYLDDLEQELVEAYEIDDVDIWDFDYSIYFDSDHESNYFLDISEDDVYPDLHREDYQETESQRIPKLNKKQKTQLLEIKSTLENMKLTHVQLRTRISNPFEINDIIETYKEQQQTLLSLISKLKWNIASEHINSRTKELNSCSSDLKLVAFSFKASQQNNAHKNNVYNTLQKIKTEIEAHVINLLSTKELPAKEIISVIKSQPQSSLLEKLTNITLILPKRRELVISDDINDIKKKYTTAYETLQTIAQQISIDQETQTLLRSVETRIKLMKTQQWNAEKFKSVESTQNFLYNTLKTIKTSITNALQ